MAGDIMECYLNMGLAWNGEDFSLTCLEAWNSKVRNCLRSSKRFVASRRFVLRFRQAWGFRNSTPQISRVAKNPFAPQQDEVFLGLCAHWVQIVGSADFWCFDETFWRIIQGCLKSWGRNNMRPHIKTLADTKRGVTIGFAVNLAGGKMPVMVVQKGKTQRALESLQLDRFVMMLLVGGCVIVFFLV